MKKIIHISGMHCVSCEIILEKELKKIEGVELLMLSHKKWVMEINYEKEDDYNKVVKSIEKNWFKVKDSDSKNTNEDKQSNFLLNIIAILLVVILFIFSKIFDLNSYIPDINTLSYSSAFFVGTIASISTCLAITWWIIIGFSKYIDSTHTRMWHVKVQFGFQIWRILWFFLLGWLLWLTWELINISFSFTWILTFIIWILLLYMWLNIMWIFPSITKFWLHMPKSFVSKIENLWKPQYAPIVWALTFFLPCWFTQTMQLLAISSGSFWSGALVMMFFALWTFPVLFSVWLGSSYFNDKKMPVFNKIIASFLVFFWIITITNSANLLSFYNPVNNTQNIVTEEKSWDNNIINNTVEEIRVWHDWWSTDPMDIVLESWKNYKLIITPTSNWKGCMSTQVIPKLRSKVSYVKSGVPITYDINNALPWTYEIVCASMWMVQGRIIIK